MTQPTEEQAKSLDKAIDNACEVLHEAWEAEDNAWDILKQARSVLHEVRWGRRWPGRRSIKHWIRRNVAWSALHKTWAVEDEAWKVLHKVREVRKTLDLSKPTKTKETQ